MFSTLLVTKFAVPTPGRALVVRPRLFQVLEQSLEPGRRLAVLSAPPGCGKTTLVSSWIRRREPALPAAWLSLDERDNDPTRFWTYLVRAVQTRYSRFGEDAVRLLQSPAHPAEETFWTVLLNDLTSLGQELVLVLDDYHFIQEPAIHRGLSFVIDRLPEGCRMMILARSDPPFPVSLLRGRGQMVEIRQADLSFSDEEAGCFLRDGLGLNLSAQDIHQLNGKSEGWAGGLQMAAAWLQGRRDPGREIASFSGANRFILDYLLEEVLNRQEPLIRDFLLETSILEVLTAPLCQAVCQEVLSRPGAPSAAQILEYLERSNLFVIPLDEARSSYRCHHLFSDLLRAQLEQVSPDRLACLHRRASAWLEGQGLAEQAIQHAVLAQDAGRAAELLAQHAGALWSRGEHATLLRLLSALPEERLAEKPDLSIYQASVWVSQGQFSEAEKCLERAEFRIGEGTLAGSEESRLRARAASARALIAALRGDAAGTLEYARLAARHQPEADSDWSLYTAYTAGSVLMMAGEFDAARQELTRAVHASRALDSPFVYLMAASQLFKLHWSQGELGQARQVIHAALAYLAAEQLENMPLAGEIQIGQAFLLMEQGLLEEAEAVIRRCIELSLPGQHYATIAGNYLILMTCQTTRQDWAGAEETYRQVAAILDEHEVPYWTECGLAGAIAWVWIRQNRLREVEGFLERRGIIPTGEVAYPHQAEYVVLAYLLVRRHHDEQAAELLDRLVRYVEGTQQWAGMVPILYIQAELFQRQGQVDQAAGRLEYALELAETYGQIQAFFALEDSLLPLLKQAAARRGGAPPALARLLSRQAGPSEARPQPAQALVEALSERELEVLALLGQGLANKEIARRLHVALQTVKFHTGNIYGKLGVANRAQAILKAQELGLFASE